MILVLLIIVAVASIAAPVVDSMLHPNQVLASVDAVRSQWNTTRNRAMEEGRVYRFLIEENGPRYKIEPEDSDEPGSEAGLMTEGELPEPCVFVDTADALLNATSPPAASGTFKTVVVFLPDGTARDDAELTFGRHGLMPATLKLRALTGAISQVGRKKEAAL